VTPVTPAFAAEQTTEPVFPLRLTR
jgi:hypothetical protein